MKQLNLLMELCHFSFWKKILLRKKHKKVNDRAGSISGRVSDYETAVFVKTERGVVTIGSIVDRHLLQNNN